MSTSVAGRGAVLAALGTVYDPELDEPVTTLGFVSSCDVSPDGDASVRLRLPTYFCAPNFAFLMVADAYDAVAAVGGVRSAEVVLEDHFASDAINMGVAARAGFARSFEGEALGELDDLRANFLRKAVLAGTDRVCRDLVAAGTDRAVLPAVRLGQIPASPALERLIARRRELGLPVDDEAYLVVDVETGEPVTGDTADKLLHRARVTRIGMEANGGICRGMLKHRYGSRGEGEEDDHEGDPLAWISPAAGGRGGP